MAQIRKTAFVGMVKRFLRILLDLPWFLLLGPWLILMVSAYGIGHFFLSSLRSQRQPRLLFGVTPIISMAHIARALKQKGYRSDTVMVGESSIYQASTFDIVLLPKRAYPKPLKLWFSHAMVYCFFFKAIWRYDIFHYYFDGGLLRHTLLAKFELGLLRFCGKKIVLLPYGSDAFVYDAIANPIWRHGLMLEYAQFGNDAFALQKRIRTMTAKADIVIACLVHFINLPRWDILPLTCYPVDAHLLEPSYPALHANPIRIAHACNHRGIKGTVFLIAAVQRLQREGFNIELDIIEKVPHQEALERIQRCDIYVDQLIFGYAQAALEAMAFGKVVISALDNQPAYDLFRRFSYLKECPILSANTETIEEVLRHLFQHQEYCAAIGRRSRQFVEKRHSYPAIAMMYEAIYRRIWWQEPIDLINFYHPLLEQTMQNENTTLTV